MALQQQYQCRKWHRQRHLHWFVFLSIRWLLADKRRGGPTGADLEALAVTDLGIVVEDKQQVTHPRTPGGLGSCYGAAATAAAAVAGSGSRGDAVQGQERRYYPRRGRGNLAEENKLIIAASPGKNVSQHK